MMRTFFLFFLLELLSLPYAFAEEVRMAFGESLPPYTLPGDKLGIEIEICKEAFQEVKPTK